MPRKKRVSDEILTESYLRLSSVWEVGKEIGMSGQSIHKRLTKLGVQKKMNKFTENDFEFLKENYTKYLLNGEIDLLANKMGRTKAFLCRKADKLGLTDLYRKKSDINGYVNYQVKITKVTKKIVETKPKIAKLVNYRKQQTWKSGWREIGGKRKYFRSRWEANYARYLQHLKDNNEILDWQHEPKVFWFNGIKRGCVSYLPDYSVTMINEEVEYHEVKGWMDNRSKTKIKRMGIYFPDIVLRIIDATWFKQSKSTNLNKLIKEWEE